MQVEATYLFFLIFIAIFVFFIVMWVRTILDVRPKKLVTLAIRFRGGLTLMQVPKHLLTKEKMAAIKKSLVEMRDNYNTVIVEIDTNMEDPE